MKEWKKINSIQIEINLNQAYGTDIDTHRQA